jgi:hypothetical protein
MNVQQEIQRAVRLNVKMVHGVEPQQSRETLSATPGVISFVQTFPDETDEELSRLYVVEVEPSELEMTLRKLNNHPGVEYAEQTAPRKLVW